MYQYYIYEFFFTTLPLGLSNTLTSSGAAGAVSANSFDIAWLTAWNAGVRVWLTLSWHDIGQEFVILLFWAAAIISSALCFTIWLVSRVFLALYIAIGPLLVASILFPAVRSIFERWIGSLISCVILQITTVVLLYIILSVELDVVNTISAMGSVDAISMIQVLLAGIIFFAVAGYVAYHLPALASSLAGGLHFQADAIARAGKSAASTVLGSTGRTQVDGQGNSSTSAGAERSGSAISAPRMSREAAGPFTGASAPLQAAPSQTAASASRASKPGLCPDRGTKHELHSPPDWHHPASRRLCRPPAPGGGVRPLPAPQCRPLDPDP